MWTKTVVTYSDGKSTTSYSVSYKGTDGDSVTIKSTVVTYQTSTSGTSVPSGTWSTTIPSVTQGQYLWTRTVVTYSPSGSTTSYSVAYQAKDGEAGDDGKMLYGTCSTAGATVAKVATVTDFTLTAGTTVSIKFTYANSAAAPTLNINSLGAKKILTNGTTYAYWAAGASVVFVYDGTQFQVCSSPVYANTVTVGNPAGQNVYIDSDSVDIRNGTTVNSSFSGNMVELGKSSLNSTIKMCDGAAVVTATEKYITLSNQLNARLLGGADITGSTSSWGLVEALSDGYNVGAVSLTSGAKNDDGGYFTAKLLLNSNNIIGKEFSQITLAADHVAIEAEGYSDLLTDWVVTEGTSGIWTYRKWASGKTECWGTKTYTNLYLDGTYGSFAYADVAFDSFPFAFPNTPKVFINLNQASGLPYCFSYGLSTTGFNVNIANWQRITATFSVAAYVLGYI